MAKTTVERQNLIESVRTLPEDVLIELTNFVDYLRYKAVQPKPPEPSQQNFLLTVAGIGQSGQSNTSDFDEAILRNEMDPIEGWPSTSQNQQ